NYGRVASVGEAAYCVSSETFGKDDESRNFGIEKVVQKDGQVVVKDTCPFAYREATVECTGLCIVNPKCGDHHDQQQSYCSHFITSSALGIRSQHRILLFIRRNHQGM